MYGNYHSRGYYNNGGYNQTPFRQFDYNNDGLITAAGIVQ